MQQNQRQKWDSFYVRTAVALLVVKEKTGAPAMLHTCYDLVKGFAPLPIHTALLLSASLRVRKVLSPLRNGADG